MFVITRNEYFTTEEVIIKLTKEEAEKTALKLANEWLEPSFNEWEEVEIYLNDLKSLEDLGESGMIQIHEMVL